MKIIMKMKKQKHEQEHRYKKKTYGLFGPK